MTAHYLTITFCTLLAIIFAYASWHFFTAATHEGDGGLGAELTAMIFWFLAAVVIIIDIVIAIKGARK